MVKRTLTWTTVPLSSARASSVEGAPRSTRTGRFTLGRVQLLWRPLKRRLPQPSGLFTIPLMATHSVPVTVPMYTFTLPIKAIPKGRPRLFRGHAVTPPETRKFESDVKKLLKLRGPSPLLDEVRVEFEFGFSRPKRTRFTYPPRFDLDNLVKSVSDACNGLLWVDDSQISKLSATKQWSDSVDYIRIRVYV